MLPLIDVILLNVISYLVGVGSGVGVFLRYKKSFILRSRSQDRFSSNPVEINPQFTQPSAPVFPVQGYPPSSPLKREIVIRDTE
jgi:hypothetical protein